MTKIKKSGFLVFKMEQQTAFCCFVSMDWVLRMQSVGYDVELGEQTADGGADIDDDQQYSKRSTNDKAGGRDDDEREEQREREPRESVDRLVGRLGDRQLVRIIDNVVIRHANADAAQHVE
jgi:hypothetical protein